MEARSYPQTLSETVQRIFEQAAFVLTDFPDEDADPEAAAAGSVAAKVQFSGPFSGEMCFLANRRLSVILAGNMLGIEEDDPEALNRSADALGEILNMICGNFLPLVAGTRAEFNISAPVQIGREVFDDLVANHPPELLTETTLYVEGGCEASVALLLDEI